MNFFEEAVSVHLQWKQRLRAIVDGREEPFDAASAASDCACELGRWIYGEGAMHQNKPAYQELLQAHAGFHQAAADLMVKVQAGDHAGALKSLNGGDFQSASSRTVVAIGNLRHELEILLNRHPD
jgi:hypothetical protein